MIPCAGAKGFALTLEDEGCGPLGGLQCVGWLTVNPELAKSVRRRSRVLLF